MKIPENLRDRVLLTGILIYGYIGARSFFQYFNLLPDFFYNGQTANVANLCLCYSVFSFPAAEKRSNKILLYIFLTILLVMIVNGFYEVNSRQIYFEEDIQVYSRFFFMMWLGFKWQAFDTIKKGMMMILVFAIVVNMLSLLTTSTFLRTLIEEKPLAYQLQYLLLPSSFYLFIFDRLTKREKIIVATAFSIYLFEQILFQKRLPIIRILTTILLFFYSLWIFRNYLSVYKVSFITRIRSIVGVLLVSAFIVTIIGFNLGTYTKALAIRFTGEGDDVSETIKGDKRWEVGDIFYEELDFSNDLLIGRGMGGVVYNPAFPSSEIDGTSFKPVAEMGTATMLLKGGYLLIFYFLILFLLILYRFPIFKKNIYSFALWVYVVVFFAFLHAEGFIVNLTLPHELLIGYAIGACLASSKVIKSRSLMLSKIRYAPVL